MVAKEKIYGVFQSRSRGSLRLSAVMAAARIGKEQRRAVQRILEELCDEGRLIELRNKHYALAPSDSNAIVGRLSVNPRGFGFVRRESQARREGRAPRPDQPDVYIPRGQMEDALHGDLVSARVSSAPGSSRPEGRVVSVLERGAETLVGRFHRAGRKGGIVVPRDRRIARNVTVMAPPPASELPDNSWVLVRLREYPPPPDDLIGEVAEVLGDDLTPGIDVLLVLRDYGVVPDFPPEAETEAAAFPDRIPEADLETCADLRDLPSFTIDGFDAKDFDDAVSIEKQRQGGYRLYVHIADVARYVRPGGALDAQAMERATSIYPVDRVVPMLPERLSNNLCSLRPNEDRLAVTVTMDVSSSGQVEDYAIHNSVIRSRHRLTYRDVQSFYDGLDNAATRRLRSVGKELQTLHELMGILRAWRLERGSLDLDMPEVEIEFDEDGAIENVVNAPRWESHQVIEECMLLANETVARHLKKAHVPILYRVHAEPDRGSVQQLAPILAPHGVKISLRSKKPLSVQLQDALDAVSKTAVPHILRRVILRALMRAQYQPGNVGHFGLASSCYTHFTSPIRRYPDLLVHRALKRLLAGDDVEREWKEEQEALLPSMGVHCSERERRADGIEEEATRICALEFMRRHLGETFQGFVSGIVNFGLFVELRKYPVEGLLHVRDLHDDRYEFDAASLTLRGRRSGRFFRLGDSLEVIVHRVDVVNQEMDFRLALLEETRPPRGRHLYESRRRRAW